MGAETARPLTRGDLDAYVKHCRDLVRDINDVLGDRRLEKQKWTFEYAVDFSEVFGFVLPQETHESWSFEGLLALTEEEKLRQFRVLARFFGEEKIYLPAPYAIELRTFYDRLRLDTVDSLMREASLALDEIRQLREDSEVRRMLDMKTDKDAMVTFFANNGSYLRAFRRGVALTPLRRLKRLLHRKQLVDLMTATGPAAAAPLVQDRYRRLLKQRQRRDDDPGAAASFLDSVAIELLRRANLDLVSAKKKRRILLVTRSKHLMRLVGNEVAMNLWPEIGDIVRHPRTFDPICRPPAGWTEHHEKDLERRRESLRLFVRSASEVLHKGREATAAGGEHLASEADKRHEEIVPDRGLQRLLAEIHKDWELSDNLATTLELDDEDAAETADEQFVMDLLSLIQRADLFDLMTERLSDIFADLNHGHEDLGFHLQQRAADRTYGHLVHSLEFSDPKLRELSERVARDWRVSLGEANLLFQEARKVSSNYERLLATALSLGALGRWQVAEDYVRRALLETDVEKVPDSEAKFLLALCIRMTSNTVARLDEALKTIEEALKTRPDDPRYLKEKGTILLRWNRLANSPSGDEYREKMPSVAKIASPLKKALANTDDPKLIAQLHNNLCYMYISPPIEDLDAAGEHLQQLEQVLTESYPDPANWPVLMHDTICLAKFRLYKAASSLPQLEAWARQLNSICNSPDLSEAYRPRIERHLEEVRSYIRDRQANA